ncbi:MAG TPA: oligosaccharide flippase family protein [Flavobacterium sp.]|jgi:O-antigen/teichoic acid export membrane protein
MSQTKKGAILSYVSILLTNMVGIVLTPFMIRTLGDSEYGLYTLIGALVGYISVLDFGLNNTIVRFVARYRAEGDRVGEENFLATTMYIYGIISLLIVLFGVIFFFNLDLVFGRSLTGEELYKSKIMFVILIFNLALTLPGGAFAAISSGYEAFVFPRALNIVKYIVRSLMVVGILMLGADSVGLVILDTIMNILVIGFNGFYVFRKLNVRIKLHHFENVLVKQIFSYSVWIFIFAMVGQFQWKAGQVILGAISGTKSVAIYGVGIMLGTYYGAFSTAISGVFLPRATKMTVQNATGEELTSMMVRIGRVSFLVLLMILGGYFLYGRQFVHLWVGETYKDSWVISMIIMVAYTIPLVQAFANSLLEAKSKFYFKAVVYISLIALGTAAGTYLIRYYGVVGLTIGTTAGWILSQIIMNFYYNRVIKLNIPRFLLELCRGLAISFLVVLAIGYCIDFIPGDNWLNLAIKIALYSVVYIVVMLKFGLNSAEVEMFRATLPARLRKKHV